MAEASPRPSTKPTPHPQATLAFAQHRRELLTQRIDREPVAGTRAKPSMKYSRKKAKSSSAISSGGDAIRAIHRGPPPAVRPLSPNRYIFHSNPRKKDGRWRCFDRAFNTVRDTHQKGLYTMAFLLSLPGAVAVHKNMRDVSAFKADSPLAGDPADDPRGA